MELMLMQFIKKDNSKLKKMQMILQKIFFNKLLLKKHLKMKNQKDKKLMNLKNQLLIKNKQQKNLKKI